MICIICRYLFLELCAGTVKDAFREEANPRKYTGPLPSNLDALLHVAEGLNYIHSKKLVHRDIKPANILISKTQPILLKVSDFSFTKSINQEGQLSKTEIRGSMGWYPPELLEKRNQNECIDNEGTGAIDIFTAGCFFFFYLKRGMHPFGDLNRIHELHVNILDGKPKNLTGSLLG